MGGNPAPAGPLYGLSALIPGDVRTSYLAFVDRLDADLEIDLSDTLEIPNAGLAIAAPEPDRFFLIDGQAPQVSRWTLGEDGTPNLMGQLSFAQISPSANSARPANFAYTAPTRGYVFDTLIEDLVLWNPQDLAIEGVVSLEEEIDFGGFFASVGSRTVWRGDELVVPMTSFMFTGSIGPTSRLLFIDSATDAVSQVVEIGCAGVSHVIVTEDGTLYAGSDSSSITNRLAELSDGDECIVRIPPGSYEIEERTLIAERTGGVPAGGLYPSSGTYAYMRVLDESLVPDGPSTIGELNGTPLWHWGRIDLAGTEDVEVFTDRDPVAQSPLAFVVDDVTWAVEPGADLASGRLVDLSGEEPVSGVELRGIVLNAFRIR